MRPLTKVITTAYLLLAKVANLRSRRSGKRQAGPRSLSVHKKAEMVPGSE